ncbi:unnamed protein product [Symbiodinium sp. CCMP2592]|nr:unnamed protein product [Symbiodinium sp. CCMP2592]
MDCSEHRSNLAPQLDPPVEVASSHKRACDAPQSKSKAMRPWKRQTPMNLTTDFSEGWPGWASPAASIAPDPMQPSSSKPSVQGAVCQQDLTSRSPASTASRLVVQPRPGNGQQQLQLQENIPSPVLGEPRSPASRPGSVVISPRPGTTQLLESTPSGPVLRPPSSPMSTASAVVITPRPGARQPLNFTPSPVHRTPRSPCPANAVKRPSLGSKQPMGSAPNPILSLPSSPASTASSVVTPSPVHRSPRSPCPAASNVVKRPSTGSRQPVGNTPNPVLGLPMSTASSVVKKKGFEFKEYESESEIDYKSELNRFLARKFHVQPGEEKPAVYNTVQLDEDQWQSTLTIPRMEARVYRGEISAKKKAAEISASKAFFDDEANQPMIAELEPSHHRSLQRRRCKIKAAQAKAAAEASAAAEANMAKPLGSL